MGWRAFSIGYTGREAKNTFLDIFSVSIRLFPYFLWIFEKIEISGPKFLSFYKVLFQKSAFPTYMVVIRRSRNKFLTRRKKYFFPKKSIWNLVSITSPTHIVDSSSSLNRLLLSIVLAGLYSLLNSVHWLLGSSILPQNSLCFMSSINLSRKLILDCFT